MNTLYYVVGKVVVLGFVGLVTVISSIVLFFLIKNALQRPFLCFKHLIPFWHKDEEWYSVATERIVDRPHLKMERKNKLVILRNNDWRRAWNVPKKQYIWIGKDRS